ncbi:DNA polymerase III subunit alpha [Pseudonocardiaceae bacterium YIM PH 21723]|nr:DNA polymerase III subunit alpha [Pseudonocardiaceae bacterium YIM PH 21723]
MTGDSFVHLHVHTEYSMLDGAAKVKPLFAEAERLGMPAVAMTDHGNMYGAAEFHKVAKSTGIKPIIGVEAYIAPGSRHHKKPVFWGTKGGNKDENDEGGKDVGGRGAYTHMTMLAKDSDGLRNLFRLTSEASFTGMYQKPRMDKELLAEHGRGIIATTGCLGGEVSTRLRLGQFQEAVQAASDYKDIFGAENFFLEVMDHEIAMERDLRSSLLEVGKQLNLKPLATNDSHYVTIDQADKHAALLCVQSGKTLHDPNRFQFSGHGYHLKSPAEIRDYWDTELPGAADNTLLVAEMVTDYDDVYNHTDLMPVFAVPEGHTEESWMKVECERGMKWRFPDGLPQGASEDYQARLDRELEVIIGKGFPGYFLVVADFIKYARENGILVGPGRGSGAGSLAAYVMGITDIDPIPYGLLFERFLNPERASMPDFDIDFDDRRRTEVIRYVTDKYGQDKVAQVITFGTIKTKAAIKDAARVLHGQPGFTIADKISKALPPPIMAKDIPLSGIMDPEHPRYTEATEVRTLIETDAEVAKIFETGRGLEGLIRNAGVHACAVIMSKKPLVESIPLWMRPQDGAIITGWDYPSCEDIGLLKMDFLGLRNLTILGDAVENVKMNHGVDIDLTTLPMDDPKTYKGLAAGDALGVFQLEGGPMRDLLRRMEPTLFEDIIAVGALYRPGPMGVNAHNDYADRKNNRQQVKPIHPQLADPLKDILGDTYGLIVYQEQIMAIAQRVAGYSLGRADNLRRAMGKKKKSVLDAEYVGFAQGMKDSDLVPGGFSDEAIKTLWDTILPFADYAFNKSHAAAYGVTTYRTMYLKANYPVEFMAALLSSVADNKDKTALYLSECRKMGIRVLQPDVNESVLRFAAVGKDIRFGLGAIRNVGHNVIESIIKTRDEKGKATSFSDFLDKAEIVGCNKRVIESLIKAGAFDSLGHSRQALLRIHEEAVDAVLPLKKEEARGQFDLFGGGDDPEDDGPGTSPLAHLKLSDDEWPRKQLLAYEREMLGLYVSAHPLDGAERLLRKHAPKAIAEIIGDAPKDGEVVLAGMIAGIDRRVNKQGAAWAIVQVEDLDAGIEVLFFPKAYSVLHEDLVEDSAIAIKGRVNWRDEKMSIFGSGVVPLDLSSAEFEDDSIEILELRADAERITPEVIEDLRQALMANRGETALNIVVCHLNRKTVLRCADYPVKVTSGFMGELKSIPGITISA